MERQARHHHELLRVPNILSATPTHLTVMTGAPPGFQRNICTSTLFRRGAGLSKKPDLFR